MDSRCTVPWCDQGTRPHTIHEWTVATRFGFTRPRQPQSQRGGRSAQLIVFGRFMPQAMLAIVDTETQEQTEIVLGWEDLASMLEQVAPAREQVSESDCLCSSDHTGEDIDEHPDCPRHGRSARVEFIPEPDAVPPF